MPIVDKKITDSEYIGNDISGLSNTPSTDGLSAVTHTKLIAKPIIIP